MRIVQRIILILLLLTTTVYPFETNTTYTIYKIGDNSITMNISDDELSQYINMDYVWSLQPTTLMYTADGRKSWIWDSEVSDYEKAGWSTSPPIVIYSYADTRTILVEELEDYLATGIWFLEKPINITMNPFEKTNLSPDELNKVLTKGLSEYGQAFYDMEQKYGVNSIFAISVAELESGSGTSYAFKNKNNAFGIGPGKRFSSVEAGIEYFGQLMNKSTYYGKSIDRIGSIYCVGGNWASKVKSLMCTNYAGLGY